jgi:hypothetical protein
MSVKSAEQVFLGAQIPASYSTALAARALREDRSKSAVVRLALAAFLFGDSAGEADGDED